MDNTDDEQSSQSATTRFVTAANAIGNIATPLAAASLTANALHPQQQPPPSHNSLQVSQIRTFPKVNESL